MEVLKRAPNTKSGFDVEMVDEVVGYLNVYAH